jgi:hypothetical protein
MIYPTNLSALVKKGSTFNPTPMSPPGTAYMRWFYSAYKEVILEMILFHVTKPVFQSFLIIPGLISTSSPTFNTPLRIVPPATPPLRFSASSPGLFTSNDLMTIN